MTNRRRKSSTSTFDFRSHVFHSEEFKSVVRAAVKFFIGSAEYRLPPQDSFPGSGVYGLYYVGGFKPYSKISGSNVTRRTLPIYVGKAVPEGWRKARTEQSDKTNLFRRLKEHANSIAQTKNLSVNDFYFRFMILGGEEIDLIVPVEAELIRTFKPLWNSAIDGFGNHHVGGHRFDQVVSDWDTLHPGRPWAEKLKGGSPTVDAILEKIKGSVN